MKYNEDSKLNKDYPIILNSKIRENEILIINEKNWSTLMGLKREEDKTKLRTPNKNCQACNEKRLHTQEEWLAYHEVYCVDNRDSSILKKVK